jgi:hypothetical protein
VVLGGWVFVAGPWALALGFGLWPFLDLLVVY